MPKSCYAQELLSARAVKRKSCYAQELLCARAVMPKSSKAAIKAYSRISIQQRCLETSIQQIYRRQLRRVSSCYLAVAILSLYSQTKRCSHSSANNGDSRDPNGENPGEMDKRERDVDKEQRAEWGPTWKRSRCREK